MRRMALSLVVPVALILAGCVSSGKYKVCVNDLADARKSASALDAKLKAAEADKAKLDEELAKLRKDKEGLDGELAKARGDLDARTKEAAALEKKVAETAARVKSLEEASRSKDAEIGKLKSEIDRLKGEGEKLKGEAAGLSKDRAKAIEEKEKAIAELAATREKLSAELKEEIRKGEIAITQLKDRLSLNLVEKILFDSGSALVKKEGRRVLDRVAEILKKVQDKQIRIEGHTDNVPISARIIEKFPSNWELSTSRATNVVRYLQEKGVDPKYLVAAGYSEYRAIAANDTAEGRSRNRRIEIVLTPYESEVAPAPAEGNR